MTFSQFEKYRILSRLQAPNAGQKNVYVDSNGKLVTWEGTPLVGNLVVQPTVRNSPFVVRPSDSGTIILVSGTVTATFDADSKLTDNLEIMRVDAGSLTAVGSGANLIDTSTGLNWNPLVVTKKYASMLFSLTPVLNDYRAYKDGT